LGKDAAPKPKPNKVEVLEEVKGEGAEMKAFQDQFLQFSDSMIVSTSASSDEIQIWEPRTLAPHEPISEKKFTPGPNTLQVNPLNYIWASHSSKNIMCVWRWDQKECELRFPLKDQLSVFKLSPSHQEATTSSICVGGSKKGVLSVWEAFSGKLIAEVESAHFMEINDLDISISNSDTIATGGKDCKVKLWLLSSLIKPGSSSGECFHEFKEHQGEVT
jgi:WD40 repeat protein